MQEIVANVDNVKFDIEIALEQQLGAHPLPFPGMDKSGTAVCTFSLKNMCSKGAACPFRHVKGDRSVVCKHWLRGLCKKGDDCEFLHEYDMSKMPECYFYSKFGQCGNKECPFLHIDPEKKIRDCSWYDRGFCRHGPNCKNRHVRRVICVNYLCGFCVDGPSCKFVHPKFDIPAADPAVLAKKAAITCHFCNEAGHKAIACPKLPPGTRMDQLPGAMGEHQSPGQRTYRTGFPNQGQPNAHHSHHPAPTQSSSDGHHHHRTERRPLDEVTCYKCGEKGHYANKCPKGHLAFLSNAAQSIQTVQSTNMG